MRVTYEYDFLLQLPDGYRTAPRDRRWPLVLFLHGLGERGRDLQRVKTHGLPKLVEEGKRFPFILISPQCPDDEWWNVLALEALIDHVAKKYRVDRERIYVTGLSMGGYGTWALAQRHPERYAAVVPICGGGEVRHAPDLRNLPLWAFHGANDRTVPLKRSVEMIDAIRAAGGAPKFTIYPEGEHNVWDETYANPELWTWLLAQKRGGAAPKKS
jgi:predicted peptidase